jgi:hypothetical protein
MKLHFDDATTIDIDLFDSGLKSFLIQSYKHLQNIEVLFKENDWNSFIYENTIDFLVSKLFSYANELSISVDQHRCMSNDQLYFNHLHQIYEKNYNGNPKWQNFHDLIHCCEGYFSSIGRNLVEVDNSVRINYRERAGLLQKDFNQDLLQDAVTKVSAGQVFCKWSELGKIPYIYWRDGEPDDIDRINTLAKPWHTLHPKLQIALTDIDFSNRPDLDQFNKWWKLYEKDWCQHWNLDHWSAREMFSVIPVGRVTDFDKLISVANRKVPLRFVRLENHSNTEFLKFDLVITADWQSHPPSIEIKIDDSIVKKNIDLVQGINHISIEVDLSKKAHQLIIDRQGATVMDRSQTVTIEKLSIDNIDCSNLILTSSWFEPIYPEPWATEQKNQGNQLLDKVPFETVLGHNGTWRLDFACPIYPCLLDANFDRILKSIA